MNGKHAGTEARRVQRVEELIAQMTLEEKVGQMTQHAHGIGEPGEVYQRVRKGRIGSFLNAGSLERRNELQKLAVEHSRLGIPLIFGRDVIHGFKTVFPIPLGQAASFNPDLVERAAAIAAHEAAETGIDWTFAPMVDVGRDPRWGRVAETCGEDPLLTATLGAAMVRGFQGKCVRDGKHLAACAKHYVGYGASESGKDYNTTWVPEQLLRDVHLPPFEACVDAGVLTLMSAFNDLNGIPASVNAYTLRRVLKDELGFSGFVVSDWAALTELLEHGLCATTREAAKLGAQAGLDMEMATTTFQDHLAELVASGSVDSAVVDDAVRRILNVKHALGLFEQPYREPPTHSVLLSAPHRQLARELAQQSVVLLKNDDALLPLTSQLGSLALVGPLAADGANQLGCWALDGKGEDSVTLDQALKERLAGCQLSYIPALPDCRSHDSSGFDEAARVVRDAELAVVVVGEDANLSGEAKSRAFLGLPGAQLELLERLAATGTPLVVIIMAGRPLLIDAVCQQAKAVLFAYHPGTMAGEALVDLLFGDVSPSGKLPSSLPRAEGQIPVYYAHKNTGRPARTDRKGVPTGTPLDPVDFDSSYIDLEVTPLFPFGYGVSYTTFAYDELEVSPRRAKVGEPVRVEVRLTNTGARRGTETVQLYVRDLVASVTRPVRELKAFRRVDLSPGEQRTLAFELTGEQLSFVGREMRRSVEPGTFRVFVGGDSSATLAVDFELV